MTDSISLPKFAAKLTNGKLALITQQISKGSITIGFSKDHILIRKSIKLNRIK